MIRSATAAPRSPAALGAELLETDRGYFESTAVLEPAGGATIARVPGLERVSGLRGPPRGPVGAPRDPARWVELVEQRLLGHGCRRARFYLTGRLPRSRPLLARGYRPQDEIGYALVVDGRPAAIRPDGPPAELRPVTSADDWAAKLAFHRVSGTSCDGHDSDPEAWVELERIRVEAGWMRPFFIVSRGAICGVIALASGESLLRLKNLVVHPSWRRMGIGTAVLQRAKVIAGGKDGAASVRSSRRRPVGAALPHGGVRGGRAADRVDASIGPSPRAPGDAMTSVVVRTDEKLAIDYWRDGYATAPSGFTSDEIAAWRAECDRLWRVVDGDADAARVQWRSHVRDGQIRDRIDPWWISPTVRGGRR